MSTKHTYTKTQATTFEATFSTLRVGILAEQDTSDVQRSADNLVKVYVTITDDEGQEHTTEMLHTATNADLMSLESFFRLLTHEVHEFVSPPSTLRGVKTA